MGFSAPVHKEFFYPDILAVREYVENLVGFCDRALRTFLNKTEEDERKNQPLEYEKRNYEYKKSYGTGLSIHLYTNSGSSSTYNDENSFRSAVGGGRLNNVSFLNIILTLNFDRGAEGAVDNHKNEFSIMFKPYETKFVRDSNSSDPEMDQLEERIIKIMEEFPSTKTIFSPE